MLNFYSASNGEVDSEKAIREAISSAFEESDPKSCDLLVIHTTIGHNFQPLLDEARRLCPHAKIVGCTCAGIIGLEGANESMRALAIMAISSTDKSHLQVASCSQITGENSYDMARQMALTLQASNPKINMIQILASGIDIAADQAISGIESVFGSNIPIFGGTSSDNMKAISSYQFVDTTILERGAVLIGYADPQLEIIMGVHHGSVPVGTGFVVTKSEKNRVYEIENQPAWTYLMDQLQLPHDTHPGPCIPIAGLGELLADDLHESYNNQHILRVVVKVDDDHSFYMPVDCQQGTRLWLTERNEEKIFSGVNDLMASLSKRINAENIVAIFHTDCAARGRAMFDKISKEEIISKMQDPLTNGHKVPWLGMYGYGEFTLLNNKNYFHNYTSSIYALIKKNNTAA